MPGARTHDMVTLAAAAAADVFYFVYVRPPNGEVAALFTTAFLFAGYACAGDLDLDSKEYRRWGPFRFIWWPYRTFIPHRSRLSHGIILGGLLRVLYLSVVGTCLIWLTLWSYSRMGPHVDASAVTRAEWHSLFSLARAYPQQSVALLAGFILAGSLHSLLDILATGIKRRL